MASPTKVSKPRELELLVADAHRQFDVNGKVQRMSFWSFKVMCRSFMASYQHPPLFPDVPGGPAKSGDKQPNYINSGAGYVDFCSWHRYSDFEWLVQQLETDHVGLIIPPLPPKETDATKDKVVDLVSTKDNDDPKNVPFVQARIRLLNLWCEVVMNLTELHETTHLKAFVAMDEGQWYNYRHHVDASRKKSVGEKLSGFFDKVTHKNVKIYDDATEMGQIRLIQSNMHDALLLCSERIKDLEASALNQPRAFLESGKIFSFNAKKPIAYPLITNGHFVSLGDKNGIVRHIDNNNYAYVEWTVQDSLGNTIPDGDGLPQRVPITALFYPESGISDPAIFTCVEAASQVESFFAYIQHRSETRELEKLLDTLWFWQAYCESIGKSISRIGELEIKRHEVYKDATTAKDPQKRQAKNDELGALVGKIATAEQTFKSCYSTVFRPLQKAALHKINMYVGRVSYSLLNDDDWPSRLLRCDKSLNPDFDIPASVAGMMEAGAASKNNSAAAESPPRPSFSPSNSASNAIKKNVTDTSDSDADEQRKATPNVNRSSPPAASKTVEDHDDGEEKSE